MRVYKTREYKGWRIKIWSETPDEFLNAKATKGKRVLTINSFATPHPAPVKTLFEEMKEKIDSNQ